jgi:hypothetical protein
MKAKIVGLLAATLLVIGCGSAKDDSSSGSAARVIESAQRCGNPPPKVASTPSCTTPSSADGFEPPCNPHLAQNAWSASHRNNFAQASSPLPGVTTPDQVNIDRVAFPAAPIVLNFSERDQSGGQAVWASTVGFTGEIVKLNADTMSLIERFVPAEGGAISTSGAYNLLDRDQNLIVGQSSALQVYGDKIPGDRLSGIAQLANFTLPEAARCGSREDELVGITMLPDGYIAFATKLGMIGVVPRQPEAMCAETLQVFSINGDAACNDSAIADADLEQVSNSIAADETSAIYVVTSGAQYRINWDGKSLRQQWRASYEGAGNSGAGRLGGGSGSTPSVMGNPGQPDRFVVLTDAQPLMHLVLMWKDDIPSDWQPIKPGRDRRIACEIPVNFGDNSLTESLSEQSVLVRGYASVVVNNKMKLDALLSQIPAQAQPFAQLLSGLSFNRPSGLQRIDWDPASRSCKTIWGNPDISIPNGIPTMSAKTGQIFGIGSRTVNGLDFWTLEAVNFASGQSSFHITSTPYPTDNSFYAATTIGPDNSVWTGTFGGVTRFKNCVNGEECGKRTLFQLDKHIPFSALMP